jgi:hypothetical protein
MRRALAGKEGPIDLIRKQRDVARRHARALEVISPAVHGAGDPGHLGFGLPLLQAKEARLGERVVDRGFMPLTTKPPSR